MTFSPSSFRVLSAHHDGRLFAVRESHVGRVAQASCTPPPPWAQPWLAGLALVDQQVVLAVAPFAGARSIPARRSVTLILADDPSTTQWGLVVDGVGTLCMAVPTTHVEPAAMVCPPGWLSPCLLADGRTAWLLNHLAISATLAGDSGMAGIAS